jgi:hypothetical protein
MIAAAAHAAVLIAANAAHLLAFVLPSDIPVPPFN